MKDSHKALPGTNYYFRLHRSTVGSIQWSKRTMGDELQKKTIVDCNKGLDTHNEYTKPGTNKH